MREDTTALEIRRGWAVGALLVVLFAQGCGGHAGDAPNDGLGGTTAGGGASVAPATPSPAVVRIDGTEYTCEALLQRTCTARYEDAFGRWGDKIDDYVNSGRLGPFNSSEYAYAEVAYNGLTACLVGDAGGDDQDFVEVISEDYPEEQDSLGGVAFLPLWFEALRTLCPETYAEAGDDETETASHLGLWSG